MPDLMSDDLSNTFHHKAIGGIDDERDSSELLKMLAKYIALGGYEYETSICVIGRIHNQIKRWRAKVEIFLFAKSIDNLQFQKLV